MAEKSIKLKVSEVVENKENASTPEGEYQETSKTMKVSYSVEELSSNSQNLFGVPNECVVAACLLAGIQQATEPEAKKIVSDFMNKGVE